MAFAIRLLTLFALLPLLSSALAHANFESSTPEAGAVVPADLAVVSLIFSEPIETRFSNFGVHRLELDDEAMPEDLWNVSEREYMRLNAFAAAFASQVRAQGADDARVDNGLRTEARTAATVEIALLDEADPEVLLEAGVYVVVWEVLSTDTHWTTGHLVFFVAP